MTRVYVPATVEQLGRWYAAGAVPSEALEEAFEAPDDTEEGEYAALMSAADASLETLGSAGGRRVVVVVSSSSFAPVGWSEVVAVHADAVDRPAGADRDEDLAWFATQEVPDLLA